jgi:hypothetical protein
MAYISSFIEEEWTVKYPTAPSLSFALAIQVPEPSTQSLLHYFEVIKLVPLTFDIHILGRL